MPPRHESFHRYAQALLPYRTPDLSTDERLTLLQGVVVDLILEIQALRMVMADAGPSLRAAYAERYRKVAALSHNGASVTTGVEKMLMAFIDADGRGEGELREEPMLRRLGIDVDEYRREVEVLERLS